MSWRTVRRKTVETRWMALKLIYEYAKQFMDGLEIKRKDSSDVNLFPLTTYIYIYMFSRKFLRFIANSKFRFDASAYLYFWHALSHSFFLVYYSSFSFLFLRKRWQFERSCLLTFFFFVFSLLLFFMAYAYNDLFA